MRIYLQEIFDRYRPLESPYLQALQDGSLSLPDFVETQVQFFHAVAYFARPMAMLAARLPEASQRMALLSNVHDEHGGGILAQSHEQTFLELLARLGVPKAGVERRPIWPEVQAFNLALAGLAATDDPLAALSALGVIEDFFARISGVIGASMVQRNWLAEDLVVHYRVHEKLDVEHSEAFYRQVEPLYASSSLNAERIQRGMSMGAYIFLRLYQDLYLARDRRWRRNGGSQDFMSRVLE